MPHSTRYCTCVTTRVTLPSVGSMVKARIVRDTTAPTRLSRFPLEHRSLTQRPVIFYTTLATTAIAGWQHAAGAADLETRTSPLRLIALLAITKTVAREKSWTCNSN